MVSKKSIYVIDSITDEPAELVRSGSTVRLSSGKNEWVLLGDWGSGAFSASNKYSISNNAGIYKTTKTLSSKNQFDISIGGGDLSALVMISAYNNSGDEEDKTSMYMAVLRVGSYSADVIKSNGITSSSIDSSSGVITIINGAIYSSKHDIKIIIISNSEEIDFDNITVGDEVANAFSTPQTGYNDSISNNASDITTNASDITTNASDITTNASDISTNYNAISDLQGDTYQNDYTSGFVLGDSVIGSIADISYCRTSRSKYITHIQAKISCSFSSSTGNTQVQFPFAISGVFKKDILGGCYVSIDDDNYIMTILSGTPLNVEIVGFQPSITSPDITFDFSVLGTW